MNGPGDIPLTLSSTPDTQPCSLISIIPTLGMSSCRGRAEAFARRLSSKLRTLGSQTDEDEISQEDAPIINGGNVNNTWITANDSEQTVTDLQPLRHESDSFFDFDCELESPGSPVDECEYLRLIETASNTPHNSAAESGYVCASAASSHSSTDGPYFGDDGNKAAIATSASTTSTNSTTTTAKTTRIAISATELPQYVNALKLNGSIESLRNTSQQQQYDADVNLENTMETLFPTEQTEIINQETINATPQQNQELTDAELNRLQACILTKLQQQSEELAEEEEEEQREITNGCSTEINEDEKSAMEQIEPMMQYTISNGHSKNGEEILEVEFTTNAIGQTALTTELSHIDEETSEKIPIESIPMIKEELESAIQCNITIQAEAEKNTAELKEQQLPELQSQQAPQHVKQVPTTLDTTDDEDECRPQRVRRCSSLKTGKTPPGTPGRKKIVRFADVLGLDLADVKTFLDEIPTIPKSAFEDLEIIESEPPIQLGPKSDRLLMPLFQQPGGLPTFLDIVREKQVSLENAAVTDSINQTITGSVRVRNLDFHKSVHIRYSLDNWRSFADLQAHYVENSCDGFSDKFCFILFGNSLQIGQRLEFAVRFQCKGQQFWDNNYSTNYCFQCLPTSTTISNPIAPIVQTHHHNNHVSLLSPTVGEAWCSSFY